MIIDKYYLKSLDPCADRYKNYLENYKDFSGTLSEFLDLPNITLRDKCWVYFRSVPTNNIPLIAADIAESVLHIFEDKYPGDFRPRKAIESARSASASAHYFVSLAVTADEPDFIAAPTSAADAAIYFVFLALSSDEPAYYAARAAPAAADAAIYAAAYAARAASTASTPFAVIAAADAATSATVYAYNACDRKNQLEIMKKWIGRD